MKKVSLVSRTQNMKGLASDSLKLKTLNDCNQCIIHLKFRTLPPKVQSFMNLPFFRRHHVYRSHLFNSQRLKCSIYRI